MPQWHHLYGAAVGRHIGLNEPTIISTTLNGVADMTGVAWVPDWPGEAPPPDEIRHEACSEVWPGLSPALPAQDGIGVELDLIEVRWDARVVQLPNAGNDYALVVEFDDNPLSSHEWYTVRLRVRGPHEVPPIPEPGAALLGLAGLSAGAIAAICRRR